MATLTLERGDLFERGKAQWLRDTLPQYEEVWARFVGNDGTSRPAPADRIRADVQDDWKKFYQYHYSLAVYAYLLDEHSKHTVQRLRRSRDNGTHRSLGDFTCNIRNFSLFVTLVGQVCDMVENMAATLKANDIATKIVGFAKQRSHSIHAACIPMTADYMGILIPTIAKVEYAAGEWSQRVPWDFVSLEKFQYLEEWYEKTSVELIEILRDVVHPMVLKAAEKRFIDTGVPAAVSTFDLYAPRKPPPEQTAAPGSGDSAVRPSGWRGS